MNQFNSNRREDKQRNIFIAIILAVLTVMTVITLIIVSLPGSAPAGSFTPPDNEEVTTGKGDDEGTNDKPSGKDHPSVGNFSDFGSPSAAQISISSSVGSLSGIKSQNAIVVDMKTNIATHAKGADEKIQIASMTKVMTLITALDLIESNDQMYDRVEIKQEYIDQLDTYQKAFYNRDYYESGNTYKVYVIDLLYSLILQSGCDSALALADYLCGSEAAFVEKMNEKADELGLENTHFTNCYGNDDGGKNYSTVREVGEMFMHALSNELAYKIITTKSGEYLYKETYNFQYPKSLVLDGIGKGNAKKRDTGDVTVLGGKSGSDDMAGFCLVSFGKTSSGEKYLVVTAGDMTPYSKGGNSYDDSAYVYKNYID